MFRGYNIVWALHFIITLKWNKCVQQFFYGIHSIIWFQRDVAKSNIKYKACLIIHLFRINIGILKWLMFITKHCWSQCGDFEFWFKEIRSVFPMNFLHGRINERFFKVCSARTIHLLPKSSGVSSSCEMKITRMATSKEVPMEVTATKKKMEN